MNPALIALFLASFGIGTTEYGPIGFLPNIAADLHVSLAKAGLIVSAYALSVTFGSPLFAIFTTRFSRHKVMMLLISTFIAGNLLSTFAPNFSSLIVARILTALCHGAFFGLGAVVAASVVPLNKKAQAIAFMIAGLTVANIVGVPLSTYIGQTLGWRAAFACITTVGLISAIALYLWIPRNLMLQSKNIFLEFHSLLRPQVMLTLLISMLASTSLFCVLTYIAPLLESVTHVSPHGITLFLMLFGIGITIGNFIGGKLADWRLTPSLIGIFILLTFMLVVFTMTVHSILGAGISILIWGILSFALIPLLQMRVVQEAIDAPNLASTINQSGFHLGNSSGALLGSLAVSYAFAYQQLIWLGAFVSGLGLAVTVYAFYKSKQVPQYEEELVS